MIERTPNDTDLDIVEQYGKLSVLYKIIVNLQIEANKEQDILTKLKKKKEVKNDRRKKGRNSIS